MQLSTLHLGTNTFTFNLPAEYGLVLIVATLIGFEILVFSFVFAGKLRSQIFTRQFMTKHFGEEHKKIFGKQISKGGYPDMGNGRYSQKLTYQQWYNFNNGQRAHYNYLQFAPTTLVFLLVAGLYFPVVSAGLGLGVIIFRIIYSVGYVNGGPAGRSIGAGGNDLCLLGLFGLALASGVLFLQGKTA